MSKISEEIKKDTEELKRKVKSIKPLRWVLLAFLLTITVCSYVFYGYLFGEVTPKNAWCHEPATGVALLDKLCVLVPVVVRCIQSITILLTVVTVINAIVYKAFRKTQREITVAGLITSMLNWLMAIITLIIVLSCFVDTTALITGAGVVTLVIGLGMQSLIADVVAGLFIVFENQFNVGDYITIDDFRGKVISIGIRTTKVIDSVNNIKIFNNNSIQGVINHDKEISVARTYIDVEYGARLPEIEQIIKKHIGELRIPNATGKPQYQGVSALGASGVTLLFTVNCHEQDIFAVTRSLNGAVKNMFDEYGIGIPFPQVVVHNPTNRG